MKLMISRFTQNTGNTTPSIMEDIVFIKNIDNVYKIRE